MSNPLLDASTQALLDELHRRGEQQHALSERRAAARQAERLARDAALRKEVAFRKLRESQEADRKWHEEQDALARETDRQVRVNELLDAKRAGARVNFLTLADSTWMPTGDSDLDGSSRWDDFDNTIPYDMRAEDCVEGSKFKLRLAQSLNASKPDSEGTGKTWRLISHVGYAIGKNEFYDRTVVQNPLHVGDNHSFSQGERGVVATVLVAEEKIVSFDNPGVARNLTVFYAVEWVKRWIDLTNKRGQNLWLQVNHGCTLPTEWVTKRDKNGKIVRNAQGRPVKVKQPAKRKFIYEPVRYIRIGSAYLDLEIGAGIADEVDPVFDEDGNVTNQDEIDSFRNVRRNLPSMAVQSTADQAVDIAYWWSEELKTLDYAVSDGDVEGYTIPGSRQYGSDKALHVETLTSYAAKHNWTVDDLDRWLATRRRGINVNAKPIQALRASLAASDG